MFYQIVEDLKCNLHVLNVIKNVVVVYHINIFLVKVIDYFNLMNIKRRFKIE